MNPMKILLVDDEANIRMMLRKTLELDGYLTAEAANGREALDVIDRDVPDVMILDLSMPVLDGICVLQELKAVRPEKKPRIIVLTAYGSITTAVKATRLGAMDFLEKPVSPDEVRESVEAVLAEPPPRPAAKISDPDPLAGGYAAVLERVRMAMRISDFALAETLLLKAEDLGERDAAYFNLMGVYYESQRQPRLAKKFYHKALSADPRYEPATMNLRRLDELKSLGRSQHPPRLGDEADILYAAMPPPSARN